MDFFPVLNGKKFASIDEESSIHSNSLNNKYIGSSCSQCYDSIALTIKNLPKGL